MARRRKTSTLDDLLNIAMKIPLWANLMIAGGSFAFLRYYGGTELPILAVTPGSELGPAIAQQILRLFAFIGQYVIPPVFLLGGILGWGQRKLRARKFSRIGTAQEPGVAIRNLTWEQFENMVGEAFRKQGFTVQETDKGPDGGIDLVLRKGREVFLVQCKQWRASKVGVQVVRELYGVMSARGATGGFVVTSGAYTSDAWRFAKGTNLQLVDGKRLVQWFKKPDLGRNTLPAEDSFGEADRAIVSHVSPTAGEELKECPPSSHADNSPSCPRCGGGMTARYPRSTNGGIANSVFLGCLNFPSCRGTRPLEPESV
ncbi:restriction endonuclease [Pseudomonas sp. DP16D-R1]|jgi:restriction system protein|uniref:restriction endonuclease n=1 Tax=Pseudomonas sp. DP16D-R1 TaxID=2075551 RepID=UPI000CD15C05|nr:restriction endonuclease [Pseudomonas sp. DP16D-R1]POA78642.1 restriction endonuclease [Pseudomonas sp. DP16D-R1]